MNRATIVALVTSALLSLSSHAIADDDATQKKADLGGQLLKEPVDTEEVLVFLKPGTDTASFAQRYGLTIGQQLRSDSDAYVFRAGSVVQAQASQLTMTVDPMVRSVYMNQRTQYETQAFTPNDTLFDRNTGTGFPGQWHLVNQWVAGRDARVQGAWNRDVTGSGVTIGIVDDSFQTTHPDLSPNYVAAHSWDFGQNDANPDPVNSTDRHGISVAGVAAARGGNSIGVTGAAPYASLTGLRIDFPTQTDQMFVDATLYHSGGASTNIVVKNHSYGISAPYIVVGVKRGTSALAWGLVMMSQRECFACR